MTGTVEEAAAPANPGWLIPRRVLVPAALIGGVLFLPLVAAFLLGGPGAALLVGLAYGAAVPLAVGLPTGRALALTVPAAMVAVIAAALGPAPLPAACLVALLVLFTTPGSPLGGSALVGIPTTAAVLVALPLRLDPVPVGGWTLFGGVSLVLLIGLLRRGTDTAPEPASAVAGERSVVHAVVSAVVVGVLVWAVLQFEVPHGYWAVMTLTVVLRRAREETSRTARRRVAGTLLGATAAVALAPFLPAWAVAVLLCVLLVAVIGYALAGNYTMQVACLTPMIILLGAAGGGSAQLAAERVLATVAGALAAGLVGWLVLWLEGRLPGRPAPADPATAPSPDVAG